MKVGINYSFLGMFFMIIENDNNCIQLVIGKDKYTNLNELNITIQISGPGKGTIYF